MHTNNLRKALSRSIFALSLTGLAPLAAHAQAAASSTDPVQEVIVTSTPNLAGVTQKRAASAAFGFDQPVVETPRSLTEISDKLLERYDIKSVYDLTTVAAGAYTGSYFGVAGSANIRGTVADNYFQGFQMITNFATYPTPVDASSSVDLVRGPPSPAYSAGQIGGYLNFTPKSAVGEDSKYLTSPTGAASVTLGSYNQREATLEGGAPLQLGSNKAGIYGFAELTDSDSYYIGMHPKSQLAQVTFNTELGKNWEGTISAQFVNSTGSLKDIGWDRITQDLIDHGNYTSGSASAQIVAPGAAYITPAAYAAAVAKYGNPVQYVLPIYGFTGVANPLTELNSATLKTVHLSPRDTYISSSDINDATTPLLFGSLVGHMDGGKGELKLESYTQKLDALNYQSYGFATDFRTLVNEERVSYLDKRDLGDFVHAQTLVGLSYRYTDALSQGYLANGVEIQDRRDLSQPLTADEIFNNVFHNKDRNGYVWDNQVHSLQTDYAAFLLEDVTFFGHLNIIGGVRGDKYYLTSVDNGPFAAANGNPEGVSVSANKAPIAYNLSISFKNPWVIPYYTYAVSKSLNVDQGDALDPGLLQTNSAIGDSTLREVGLKTSQFGGRLFGALDGYMQTNTYVDVTQGGVAISSQKAKGIEAELRYLVTPSFGITAAATYQQRFQLNSAGSSGTFLIITPQQAGVSNVQGWGGQFETNSSFVGLPTTYELHSQPNFYGSLFATYDHENLWGLTGGFTYNSWTGGSIPGSVRFPSYTLVKIGGYTMLEGVRLDLTVSNLLDTRYFIAEYDVEANTTALPGVGREFHLKLSKKF